MTHDEPSYPHGYHRPNQLWQVDEQFGRRELSLRGKRGATVASITLVTMGLLLIGFWQPWRNQTISPGPLTSAHAQALAGTAENDRCNVCHEAANMDPLSLVLIAAGDRDPARLGQAAKCLQCHGESMNGDLARLAHNVSAEHLARMSAKRVSSNSIGEFLRVKHSASGELACSTCHREHHGVAIDLKAMTDQQCQSCHAATYHSFETDHPEFRRVPQQDRQIAFDHVAHKQKHFPEKQTAFACEVCHQDDDKRNVKKLTGFEQSCAKCHTAPIRATSLEGIVAFSLPTVDVDRLKNAGHDLGEWPEEATGDFDGTLSPLVRMLLMADENAALALEQLNSNFDFQSFDPTDETNLARVGVIARALKKLLADLANDPSGELKRRLEKVGGRELSPADLSQILESLPSQLFIQANAKWFPANATETTERQSTETSRVFIPTIYQLANADEGSELLVENPFAKLRKISDSLVPNNGPAHLSDSAPRKTQDNIEPLPPKKIELDAAPVPTELPGELLVDNPLAKSSAAIATQIVIPKEQEVPKQPEPDLIPVTPIAKPPADENASVEVNSPAVAPINSSGPWSLDEVSCSIRYQPSGHADPMLRLLLDTAARSALGPARSELLAIVAKDASAMSCVRCHSFERVGEETHVNWHAQYRDASRRSFTEFSHRPHLVQPHLRDCSACHQLNATKKLVATDAPLPGLHDFLPLQKSSCVSCHNSQNASGSCTQCHSYHVGIKRGE